MEHPRLRAAFQEAATRPFSGDKTDMAFDRRLAHTGSSGRRIVATITRSEGESREDRADRTVSWQYRRVHVGVATTILAALAFIAVLSASVRIVQPAQMYVVELLGRYRRRLEPGIHLLVPFIESIRAKVNMREQVANVPPQPAITSDNMVACVEPWCITGLWIPCGSPTRSSTPCTRWRC